MGVSRIILSRGGPTWAARYRRKSQYFSVSKYGEAEAKRLAEVAFAEYGALTVNGRAFKAPHCDKKFSVTPNVCFHWKPSRATGKPYPYILVNFIPQAGTYQRKAVNISLAKNGIKNSTVRACKHLLQAGYPEVLESKLADEVRTALLTSYVEQGFDLKLIPDFY